MGILRSTAHYYLLPSYILSARHQGVSTCLPECLAVSHKASKFPLKRHADALSNILHLLGTFLASSLAARLPLWVSIRTWEHIEEFNIVLLLKRPQNTKTNMVTNDVRFSPKTFLRPHILSVVAASKLPRNCLIRRSFRLWRGNPSLCFRRPVGRLPPLILHCAGQTPSRSTSAK